MSYFCEAICEKLSVWVASRRQPGADREELGSQGGRAASHSPEILSSNDEARAVMLEIPAGESLQDHQVHERAWVSVIEGEVEITTTAGENVAGGTGLMVEFAPGERHAVRALTTARLLLLLTPWPGDGHPGTMPLSEKATVRQRAAAHRAGQ